MPLPNTGMDAVPFTPLTAEFVDQIIENIEALAAGTGLDNLAVSGPKISPAAVSDDKRTRLKACVLGTVSGQTISADTNTALTMWDEEIHDPEGWHEIMTNPGRITVTEAGLYLIQAQIGWSGLVGEYIYLQINIDGVSNDPLLRSAFSPSAFGSSFANYTQASSYPIVLAANQYVDINIFHSSTTNETAGTNSWFSVVKLSD